MCSIYGHSVRQAYALECRADDGAHLADAWAAAAVTRRDPDAPDARPRRVLGESDLPRLLRAFGL